MSKKQELKNRAEQDAKNMINEYGLEHAKILSFSYLDEAIRLNCYTDYWDLLHKAISNG